MILTVEKLKEENLKEEDINNMGYFQCCNYLNMIPVLLAQHFQYRVEIFFKVIVVDGSLGKVIYHTISVKFQIRGSPHIHSLLWIPNTNDVYIKSYMMYS